MVNDSQNQKFIHPLESQQDNNSQMFDSQYDMHSTYPSIKKDVISTLKRDAVGPETCTQDLIAQLQTGIEKDYDISKENAITVNQMSQEDCIISMIQNEGFRATRTKVSEILSPESREDMKKKYTHDPFPISQHDIVEMNNGPSVVQIDCPCLVSLKLSDVFTAVKLVQCQDCKKWGHSVCFGYETFTGNDSHSCFDCSPLSVSADTASINQVALLRLGITIAFEKGIKSKNWMSVTLGLPLNVSNPLINLLLKEGFIYQTEPLSASRRPRFACEPIINARTAQKKRDIFSNNYFDELFLNSSVVAEKRNVGQPDVIMKRKNDSENEDDAIPSSQWTGHQPKKRKVSIARKALIVL